MGIFLEGISEEYDHPECHQFTDVPVIYSRASRQRASPLMAIIRCLSIRTNIIHYLHPPKFPTGFCHTSCLAYIRCFSVVPTHAIPSPMFDLWMLCGVLS